MFKPKMGKGVILGNNVQFGKDVTIWNYVVLGNNTKIGDGTQIGSFCDIGANVIIGKNCNIQTHVAISNGCQVGNNVFIAPNCTLINDKFPPSKQLNPPTIKDNAIVGGKSLILPKVTIGKYAVIAAGSVVTHDVAPNTLVMGFPAKPMMTRDEYDAKRNFFDNPSLAVNK